MACLLACSLARLKFNTNPTHFATTTMSRQRTYVLGCFLWHSTRIALFSPSDFSRILLTPGLTND